MDFLHTLDRDLLLAINGWHSPWADDLMWFLSWKFTWVPLYVLAALFLWHKFGWKQALLLALMAASVFGIADRVSSGVLKNNIRRPRPCHNEEIRPYLHLPDDKCAGSKNGFVSSHAANMTGLAFFLAFAFSLPGKKEPQTTRVKLKAKYLLPFLLLAFAVAYSRVYLGVHFPADVVGGALLGIVACFCVIPAYRWISRKIIVHPAA